jgi:hypothetical protein
VKATADDWQRQPFEDVVPIPYRAAFAEDAFARLQAGLVPRAMEDKWFVYFEAPELYFHRSWTGQPVYRIVLERTEDGAVATDAFWSKALADAPGADPAYQARLLHFLVSNLLLGQSTPFPQPDTAHAIPAGLFQHHIAGTGHPETRADAPAPVSAETRTTHRRLRDRLSTVLTVCVAGIAGAAILVVSLWRKARRR